MNDKSAQENQPPGTGADSGLKFLEGIERKHDELLLELDQLNARIESVLQIYQKSRNSIPSPILSFSRKAA